MAFPAHGAIITAGGMSTRFSQSLPSLPPWFRKEFIRLDEETVLYHSVAPFFSVPNLAVVVITFPEGLLPYTERALSSLLNQNEVPMVLVPGGASRQESVNHALAQIAAMDIPLEFVSIHDGARPWLTPDLIISTLATASVFGGAAPAIGFTDSIKEINASGVIINHPNRDHFIAVQTPQIFDFKGIHTAHQVFAHQEPPFRDDTELFAAYGGKVGTSLGSAANKKITTVADIPNGEVLLANTIVELEAFEAQLQNLPAKTSSNNEARQFSFDIFGEN